MKLALFDFNNLLYKGCAVSKELTFDGVYTGGLYMFLSQLCTALSCIHPDKIVFVHDSPPYKRLEQIPDYKQDRKVNEELRELTNLSRPLCEELLSVLGVTTWKSEGLEADDLIAILTTLSHYTTMFDEFVICSNDDDLYQLLKPHVSMWRGVDKGYYILNDFKDDFGVDPMDWISICALKGTHNGIKGFKNIGPKRALDIIKNEDKWDAFFDSQEKIDMFELYATVIGLPYVYPKAILNPKKIGFVDYVRNDLVLWLNKYGIKLTSQMSNALFDY